MEKRIVIAGCRSYENYEEAKRYIDYCISNIKSYYTLIFVSGGCRGADFLGEKYAIEKGYEVERYMAEWDRYGRGAGPKRNAEKAEKADYIICFWDGKSKGTNSMIEFAKRFDKQVYVKRVKV